MNAPKSKLGQFDADKLINWIKQSEENLHIFYTELLAPVINGAEEKCLAMRLHSLGLISSEELELLFAENPLWRDV